MIAANGVTARYLAAKGLPSLRRVLRTPKRWDRIAALAAESGERLPLTPDAAALDDFLNKRRNVDPLHFADISLAVVKLLGSGEYALQAPGQPAEGHFGLAVRDYAHSTAPNRRFPDLVAQRLLKAALAGLPSPYTNEELTTLAPLHRTGRQRGEGGTPGQEVRCRAAPGVTHRRPLRRYRHWRGGQGNMGANFGAFCGRPGRARSRGPRRRRPRPRGACPHRRRARVYRFRRSAPATVAPIGCPSAGEIWRTRRLPLSRMTTALPATRP